MSGYHHTRLLPHIAALRSGLAGQSPAKVARAAEDPTRGLNVLFSELRLIPRTVHLQMQNVHVSERSAGRRSRDDMAKTQAGLSET